MLTQCVARDTHPISALISLGSFWSTHELEYMASIIFFHQNQLLVVLLLGFEPLPVCVLVPD